MEAAGELRIDAEADRARAGVPGRSTTGWPCNGAAFDEAKPRLALAST